MRQGPCAYSLGGLGAAPQPVRFRFRRAALAGVPLHFWWEVVSARRDERLRGELVALAGKVSDEEGTDCVKAVGKILLVDSLLADSEPL